MGPALLIDEFLEFLIRLRIDVAEGQILQFAPHLAHPQPVRKRRVDFHGFPGNRLAPVGRKVPERSHVVETVCKLDHDDADVVRHGEEHLTEILSLLRLLGRELDLADLGHTIDDVSDFRSKKLFDTVERNQRVLDNIVQKSDADRDGVHLHLGQQIRDLQRMRQVRLAGRAHLSLMFFRGKYVGAAHKFEVVPGMMLSDAVENVLQADHVSDYM